jgi:hypothetical protein
MPQLSESVLIIPVISGSTTLGQGSWREVGPPRSSSCPVGAVLSLSLVRVPLSRRSVQGCVEIRSVASACVRPAVSNLLLMNGCVVLRRKVDKQPAYCFARIGFLILLARSVPVVWDAPEILMAGRSRQSTGVKTWLYACCE